MDGTKPRCTVKRLTLVVYARDYEADEVCAELREWFAGSDFGLWQPRGIVVDDGPPDEHATAEREHPDAAFLDEGYDPQ